MVGQDFEQDHMRFVAEAQAIGRPQTASAIARSLLRLHPQ